MHLAARNSSSSAAICLSSRLLEQIALYARWEVGVTGGAGGGTPIFLSRRTSPLLEAGMCASGCAAILELLVGMRDRFAGGFYLGGLARIGDRRLTWTSALN